MILNAEDHKTPSAMPKMLPCSVKINSFIYLVGASFKDARIYKENDTEFFTSKDFH